MALNSPRPFFRSRMLNLGYNEHDDAIDFNNIGATVLDDTFHMETTFISSGPANQRVHNFVYGVVLRVFKRGFRDPVEAHDEADNIIRTILADLLAVDIRNTETIKDIVPSQISKLPLSGSDDNDLVIEFNFNVNIVECF